MTAIIETKGLAKRFGTLTALDGLDLRIAPGETFGLLGPNGAGKTTALRLLAGLSEPSAGTVRVGGRDPWQEPEAVRRSMGVLMDGAALYERLTVEENLLIFAGLFDIPRARVMEALEQTGMADLARRPAGKLSKGQRQRVALARAILHAPSLLVLDEPTSGLDPAASAAFHDLIRHLNSKGATVVLCSHDMAEVDQLCSRVGVLDRGRLMACDSPLHLKAAYGRRAMVATVETSRGIQTIEWEIDAPDGDERLAECRRMGRLLTVHTKEATLAEVFIRLTGRKLA